MITFAKFAAVAALAATTATTPASCDTTLSPPPAPAVAPPAPAAPPAGRQDIEVQAMCDEHGNAYDVIPNTPDAHVRATEMCFNIDQSLEGVGW